MGFYRPTARFGAIALAGNLPPISHGSTASSTSSSVKDMSSSTSSSAGKSDAGLGLLMPGAPNSTRRLNIRTRLQAISAKTGIVPERDWEAFRAMNIGQAYDFLRAYEGDLQAWAATNGVTLAAPDKPLVSMASVANNEIRIDMHLQAQADEVQEAIVDLADDFGLGGVDPADYDGGVELGTTTPPWMLELDALREKAAAEPEGLSMPVKVGLGAGAVAVAALAIRGLLR